MVILLANFRVWMQPSSIPKHGDARRQACRHRRTGTRLYGITSDQLIDSDHTTEMMRYQDLMDVTNILRSLP